MFHKLTRMLQMIRLKKSGHLGDLALLKFDLFGTLVSPALAPKLADLRGYHPQINLDELSQYPPDSLGRVYAEHLQKHHLQPLNISPDLEEVANRNVFAWRYVVTHDIFHVVLGFDTTYAGEIGVLAFAVGQNYSPALKIGLWIAKLLYPLLAPQQIKAIFSNVKKGREMAKNSEFLLAYRFEEHWLDSLEDVRTALGLPPIAMDEE
jgi:ubiquinone biosynthesis protein COQ4